MRRQTVARRMLVLAVAVLVLAGASPAYAAKPERGPATPALIESDVCAFPVQNSQEGNYTETTFADGRIVITGSGRDTVTNVDADISLTLKTSGKITITEVDGDQRLQASGRTLFWFYAGDQGPFGPVGANGALYYIVGHVDQILDQELLLVTSFEWSGRATELCSLISP
ncbi:MAG TPA: hypothetical protein VFS66_06350 [Acidimicrobiia bacterium]|nr:hypothetical protein [Acidimicrobiia bacterium]